MNYFEFFGPGIANAVAYPGGHPVSNFPAQICEIRRQSEALFMAGKLHMNEAGQAEGALVAIASDCWRRGQAFIRRHER